MQRNYVNSIATVAMNLTLVQGWQSWLVSALVLSLVDYCNSSLAGLPALAPLQRVLNAATCYVADQCLRDHMTLVQRSLHWLPIHQRVQYKLCILTYRA